MDNLTTINHIENKIFTIRGQKVMIDRDLAELYGIQTKRLNEAVRRNIKRFPSDFMFQLTKEEWSNLWSQFATANVNLSKIRYLPYVFTEHGVTMLASILNSDKAVEINVQIVRAFIQLRKFAIAQTSKSNEIDELRRLLLLYIEKNDSRISEIISVLNNLIESPRETKKIGF